MSFWLWNWFFLKGLTVFGLDLMGWVREDLEVLDFLGNSTFLLPRKKGAEIHLGQTGWCGGARRKLAQVTLTAWQLREVEVWLMSLMSIKHKFVQIRAPQIHWSPVKLQHFMVHLRGGHCKIREMHPHTIQQALGDELHHRRDLDKRSTYVEAHATETRMQLEPLEKETLGQRHYFSTHEIISQYVATFVFIREWHFLEKRDVLFLWQWPSSPMTPFH